VSHFPAVDKTAAKLPRFGEGLTRIARVSAGTACGATRLACGMALRWRLAHLNAKNFPRISPPDHALHLLHKHDPVRAAAAQPVLYSDCGGHQRVDMHHSEERRRWVDEVCSFS
jgi:hypothetical protein